jgi:hypothetical protein
MTDLEHFDGVCSVSWRFEHASTNYLLQVALPPEWVLTAEESELKWTPIPTVEVRMQTGATYRTMERLPIPGATKRHVPIQTVAQIVREYRQRVVSATAESASGKQ